MRRRFILASALCLSLLPGAAWSQEDQDDSDDVPVKAAPAAKTGKGGNAPLPAAGPATPAEPDLPPPAAVGAMDDMPVAELQALDKITARVSKLETRVGQTTGFGSLGITVKACRKAPPENTPESAAFLQVWEQKPGEESKWVYRGWMFASSPALAAMDHPVYDIWLVDCKKDSASTASSTPPVPVVPAPPPVK